LPTMAALDRPAVKARPVYLNLFAIRQPLPAIVSILHRISGALLFLIGIPFLLWVVQRSLGSPDAWAQVRATLSAPLAKLVLIGIGKFADHMQEAIDFEHYGVPLPDLAVWVSGVIEVGGGALLVVGLATRLAAALVAGNLVVAIATAGVMEGGTFHLGVGPALLAAMLFLVWAGGGRWSLDARLTGPAPPPQPNIT